MKCEPILNARVKELSGKTLYVSDLDGTLLNSRQALSEFTVNTINSLVEQGVIFSYATARSSITAAKVTNGISPQIPIIVYNGAFILENSTRKMLLSNYFHRDDVERILEKLTENDIYPIVYSYIDGAEKFSYIENLLSRGAKDFAESRKGDGRDHPVESLKDLRSGDVFYISCIDGEEKLEPMYQLFREEFQCIYQKDIYSGEQWLEILPKQATKANAVLQLKNMLGCDKVVSFGDGKNDISMFNISDECYAVKNANAELKKVATAVIESNNEDGVAKWLAANCAHTQ